MTAATTTPSATAPASPSADLQPASGRRITSIDLLRGLVMIIMALDHTRDYFHKEAFTGDPLNLETTTPLLFFTRFITHYCAPVFVFLAGTSGFLQSQRKSRPELSRFLVTRGLWLMLAEVTILHLTLTFDPGYHVLFLLTIWSIGVSMLLLGLAVHLPFRAILAIGILLVFGHNALDFYEAGRQQFPAWYLFLHRPGPVVTGGPVLLVGYPFLPWTGLMLLGYCFGKLYTGTEARSRRRILVVLGTGLLVFFVALRATNAYGDARHWSPQSSGLYTLMSFLNVVKNPPSLLFVCVTIGPALLFLAFAGETRSRLGRIISVYGSVPFFYYFLHFLLLHIITAGFYLARGHSVAEGMQGYKSAFNFVQPGEGLSLAGVYLVWMTVVVALYPACRWFAQYKKTHRQWWLSYL